MSFLKRQRFIFEKKKSMRDLSYLVQQVSDFIKFVKLKLSHISLNLSNPVPLFLKSILKSPINIMFSYLSRALLKTFVSSSKKIVKFLDTSGLYILKQIHLLFEIVHSEQIHAIL